MSIYLNVQVVSKGNDDLLNLLSQFSSRCKNQSLTLPEVVIDLLENRDREGSRLSGTGLGLGDDIAVLKDGHNGSLLDGRRTLKPWREEISSANERRNVGKIP